MSYPSCPEGKDKACRFRSGGATMTLMYSPITYDREDNPVGGGANTINGGIECTVCKNSWTYKQTELEQAQGKPRDYKLADKK